MAKTRTFLCGLLAINFVLFVLTFVPAFSGIGRQPGLADRLWGEYRFAGWRADVVWVVISTFIVFLLGAAYAYSPSAKRTQAYKPVVIAWATWLGCFGVYVSYSLIHMFG